MEIINSRKYYMRKEYEHGKIYNTRKAMAARCPICGGWIDRSSMASLETDDRWGELYGLSEDTLRNMWVLTPYCVACMG